ncbi:hypothetical protein C3486_02240 [Streptomyces sp. Ru73]|uniref:hypothetical protein n=1 Tax=Streptomyces sp. Ru73 TaxID=2080748 RepID=UPI000CDD486D|nr:hypothetical protein [Streptomyces sp. Ru73]POX43060.1 hypothetical protein C3486_02240 [Streptomyces sp. Ru73]
MSRLTRFKNHLLAFVHEVFADDADIYRQPRSSAVLADCYHEGAEAILLDCGFERPHGWQKFHLPQHFTEAEKKTRATQAAFRLLSARYDVNIDNSLLCPATQEAHLDGRCQDARRTPSAR